MNIKQEIAELKTRLEQLEAECKATEESEWPKMDDEYFYIHGSGDIHSNLWDGVVFDQKVKAIGNIFKTQQEAEAEIEARKVIAELRATEGRVNGYKYLDSIYGFEVGLNSIDIIPCISEVGLFWSSEEHAQQAINQVGEARIIAAVKHFGRV